MTDSDIINHFDRIEQKLDDNDKRVARVEKHLEELYRMWVDAEREKKRRRERYRG